MHNRTLVAVSLLGLSLALAPAPVHGQTITTTLNVAAGATDAGAPNAATGVRVELRRTWGAYVRVARRLSPGGCDSSLPPQCSYPQGTTWESALGLIRSVGGDEWRSYASLGGGVLSWENELDPFVDMNAELRHTLSGRTAFVIGVHVMVAPDVEREPNGLGPIVSKRTVVFTNSTLGLAINIW